MIQVCIEDTEEECEATQAAALINHLEHHGGTVKYTTQTTRWSAVRARLDGRYDTDVCNHHDYGDKLIQDYNPDDYPIIDDD